MTTGELLSQSSDVSNVSAIVHLQNLSITQWSERMVPYDSITFDYKVDILDIDIEKQVLDLDLSKPDLDIDFTTNDLDIDIETNVLDIDKNCTT